MATSIWLSQIIGPFFIIVCIGVLANRKAYEKLIGSLDKNAAFVYLDGVFALLMGLLIVLTHNVWASGWPFVITLIGWLFIVKGCWLLVFPDTVPALIKIFQKEPLYLSVCLAVIFAAGLGLTIFGYFAA